MKYRAEKYELHKKGCKRLCCNNTDRCFPLEEGLLETPKKSYLRPVIYTLGVVALLSALTYCSQPRKEPIKTNITLLNRLN